MHSSVTLGGNVVKAVVLRETKGGAVAGFRIAVPHRYFDKRTSTWAERTTYVDVVAWRRLAENVAASVQQGHPVVVVGKLHQREYERDGRTVLVIEVEAETVGHDLSSGVAQFARNPRGSQTADLVGLGIETDVRDGIAPLGALGSEWPAPEVGGEPAA